MSEPRATVLLDPTSERSPVARERVARLDTLEGKTVGLLDISKPRGDVFLDTIEARLRSRRRGAALYETHLHQAGAGRPPTRDRDALRRGGRSAG